MRPRGSGSITHLGGDRYRLRWWQEGRRKTKVVHGTEDKAHAILDKVVAGLAEQGNLGCRQTVKQFGAKYLDRIELQGFRSIDAARSRWRCHVEPYPLARLPLDEVRPRHVRQLLDRLAAAGLGAQSRRHVAWLLSGLFRDALELELVDRNPVTAVRKPTSRPTRRDQVLSVEQLEVLEHTEGLDEHARWIALTLAGTGLRPGELLGLELGDVRVDDEAPHLLVRRSGRRRFCTKTDDRVRRVELFGLGLRAVRRLLDAARYRIHQLRMREVA